MQNKWIKVLIAFLALTGLIYLFQRTALNKPAVVEVEDKTRDSLNLKADSLGENQLKNPTAEAIEGSLDLSVKNEIDGIPMTQWLAEIQNPKYSDDPMLEVTSLIVDFKVCGHWLRRIAEKAEQDSEIKNFELKLKKKCESYAEQYPLIFSAHNDDENLLSFPSKSLLGERYKFLLAGLIGVRNVVDYDQLMVEIFQLSLQINNPNLISFNALSAGIGLSGTEDQTDFFKELLQTDINIWVFEAHNLATQSLSCDLPNSSSCDATSYYMVYKCDYEPNACGMSFQEWYQQSTTPGMKKDAEIIKNYYRQNSL